MKERRPERREIGKERGRETGVKERRNEGGRREEGEEREGQRGMFEGVIHQPSPGDYRWFLGLSPVGPEVSLCRGYR